MRRRDVLWWAVVAAALGVAAVGARNFLLSGGLSHGAPWWLGGLLILYAAAFYGDRTSGLPLQPPAWRRDDSLALLSVLAAAVFFHLWRIASYPPLDLFGFEEYQTGGHAFRTWDHWEFELEFPLTNFLPGISFRLFGFSGLSLRLPFLLSGIAAPVFLLLALRRLVSLPAAWAGAMLLASCRWAAAAARFADEIFFPISIVALSLWLLVCAVQDRRLRTALAFAVVSADLFYAYSGYRVFPFIVLCAVSWQLVAVWWQGGDTASRWRAVALALAAWLILLLPGSIETFHSGTRLFSEALYRHADAWASGQPADHWHEALNRMLLGWKVFAVQGDDLAWANIPNEPMLDPITAALFTLSLPFGLWWWRRPWERGIFLGLLVPITALAVIPSNVNLSRYFVVLVPLFALIAFVIDALFKSSLLRRWATPLAIGLAVSVCCTNALRLERLATSPVVAESFQYGENTVVAALHHIQPPAKVMIVSVDGRNGMEPSSDYRWFTYGLQGDGASLDEALRLPNDGGQPLYWVVQFAPEIDLMGKLLGAMCDGVQSQVTPAQNPWAGVGTFWVGSTTRCHSLSGGGLNALYATQDVQGRRTNIRRIDPALTAYTVPFALGNELSERRLKALQVEWMGTLNGATKGSYELHLELLNATGSLRVGDAEAEISQPGEWRAASLRVELANEPVPLRVEVSGVAGAFPRVRLFWKPPNSASELVPPAALRPEAQ